MRDLAGRLELTAINTATLGHRAPIGETVDAIARAGFGGICPWRRDLAGEDVAAVARRVREAGLAVSGYCRSTCFPAPDRRTFEIGLADNRRALEQAAALGAACFVLVVGSLPTGSRDLDGARAQVEEGIGRLAEDAHRLGTRLAIEPLHPMYAADRSCVNTLAQALDMAERLEPAPVGAPLLGVAIDAYHVWWDPDLARDIARAGAAGRILAFHVCDWLAETKDLLLDRGMMGDGVIDLRAIRARVEAAGFAGAVEVEIFSAADWWVRPAAETLAVCAERLQTVC